MKKYKLVVLLQEDIHPQKTPIDRAKIIEFTPKQMEELNNVKSNEIIAGVYLSEVQNVD